MSEGVPPIPQNKWIQEERIIVEALTLRKTFIEPFFILLKAVVYNELFMSSIFSHSETVCTHTSHSHGLHNLFNY